MTIDEPPPRQIIRLLPAGLPGAHTKYFVIESDPPRRTWLFKPQHEDQVAVDVAAARIAHEAGVPSPIVYSIQFRLDSKLYEGSIQPVISDVRAREIPPYCLGLTSAQRECLQRHQVLDWLLGNPDTHREQFLVLEDGSIVAVDKSQSLLLFPSDRLEWDPRPRWPNTRRSVYRYLRSAAERQAIALNPQVAIHCAEGISIRITSERLRAIWRPAVSLWPLARLRRAAGGHSIRTAADVAAAVERVLDAIVARKERLSVDFERLYYQRSGGPS
jgi:hypothetical protein